MKFLVIWKIELSLLSPHVASAVARMQAYAKPLERSGRIAARYHIVGAHAGPEVTVTGYQTVAQRNLTCAIRIRERRRQLGLTQAEVVDRVNGQGSRLSNQALSAIENGRRLAVGRLPDLAAALHCTVSYLLGLTADPGRWEPDDSWPEVPGGVRPEPSGGRAGPGTNGTPGRAIPPRRSWILGPDVPDATTPSL